jgi:Pro-kumamolisin, activation domain
LETLVIQRRVFSGHLVVLFLAAFFAPIPVHAEQADRVTLPVDATKVQVLPNHHPAWANRNNAIGLVPAGQTLDQLTMVLARSPQQEHELEQLLSEQQNPASANYHHWLTPSEMGDRFGLSQGDIDTVRGWLESQGLHVNFVTPSRMFIGFKGTAAEVGRAFQTDVRYYNVRGVRQMSVSSDPKIPEALAPVITAVRGLYTVEERPLHSATTVRQLSPRISTKGGSHFIGPADFATIYDLPTNLNGSGFTIGIVGRSRTDFTDYQNFENFTGTSFANPTEIIPTAFGGVDPGPAYTTEQSSSVNTGDQGEATLDVTRAASIAQGATVLLVVATNASGGILPGVQYLVNTEPVPAQIINISFGACEAKVGTTGVSFFNPLFQQAAAEGISVFVSAGDSAAAGCDQDFTTPPATPAYPISPNYICSSSYATCVGGSEFNDSSNPSEYWRSANGNGYLSALGYIPEGAWNEPLDSNSQLQVAGGGGGVSQIIATPSWQSGAGVPSARSGRYTPDMVFTASQHDGYFGCLAAGGGGCDSGSFSFEINSGTSAAAPDMAGVTALLDQEQGGAVGNVAPSLYAMAASAPSAFHDVTLASSGVAKCALTTPSLCNNSVAGATSLTGGQAGYKVNIGFDEATGLGSLDVTNFINNFVSTAPMPLQFVKVTPCRVVDTRNPTGPFGGPVLAALTSREFEIPNGACNIPSSAVAYSLNVTVVPIGPLGYLTIWPSGQTQPLVSTLNSDGRVKANAAITPAGTNGGVSVYVTNESHLILDIDGYFVPKGTGSALAFYPVTPCRILDTRKAVGPLGGPYVAAGTSRDFPVQSSSCGLPSGAQAYSLNVTAVPRGSLGYLTLWASGQAQPLVSTLNDITGTLVANAAIVPAASDGDISIYASNSTDVVLDVDGYFAAPATGGLSLYTTAPCRVLDTRQTTGAFDGVLQVGVEPSTCGPPSTAQAYVLNATIVAPAGLGYLSLWPAGENQPTVSTLNAIDGATTSNMAIVPTNNGNIDAFSSNHTQLILDLSSYFAP